MEKHYETAQIKLMMQATQLETNKTIQSVGSWQLINQIYLKY